MSLALIPNLLTLSRVVFVPFVVTAILRGDGPLALLLVFVAAATDVLDGWLARRFGWRSPGGAYLDPLADKLLLSGVYIALGFVAAVPWWLVGTIFARDVGILIGAGLLFALTGRRSFPPSVWGKLSTFVQIATALTLMVARAAPALPLQRVSELMILLAAAATIWSGLDYLRRALRPTAPTPTR